MADTFRLCSVTGFHIHRPAEALIKANAVTGVVFLAIGRKELARFKDLWGFRFHIRVAEAPAMVLRNRIVAPPDRVTPAGTPVTQAFSAGSSAPEVEQPGTRTAIMPRTDCPAGTTFLPSMMLLIALLAGLISAQALAGGSNYGANPGIPQQFSGKVREWAVPTPRFARDPAVAPDGSIFIAVMTGNKVARFDPKSQTFTEWNMPRGHHPHGLLVDRRGTVWTTGNGNGTIGRLDPTRARPARRSGRNI